MKGGLIGHIPENKLISTKSNNAYTEKSKRLLKYLAFPNNNVIESKINIQGSYTFPVYPYYSDIDSINKVNIKADYKTALNIFNDHIQQLAYKIKNNNLAIQFSDLKCGLYPNKKGIHWTLDEIIKGKKDNKYLIDALTDDGYCKIDIITPYYGRYIEISMIYNIMSLDGYIGQKPLTLEDFKKQIKISYNELIEEGNYYKAIKRLYSLSRLNKDTTTIKKILPLLTSNLGKLSTIKSDLATIELIIKNGNYPNLNYINQEFNKIKEGISTILDIPINHDAVYDTIDNIYNLLRQHKIIDVINELERVQNIIYKQLNIEVIKYMNYKNYKF